MCSIELTISMLLEDIENSNGIFKGVDTSPFET
jgi:hypothetical protein